MSSGTVSLLKSQLKSYHTETNVLARMWLPTPASSSSSQVINSHTEFWWVPFSGLDRLALQYVITRWPVRPRPLIRRGIVLLNIPCLHKKKKEKMGKEKLCALSVCLWEGGREEEREGAIELQKQLSSTRHWGGERGLQAPTAANNEKLKNEGLCSRFYILLNVKSHSRPRMHACPVNYLHFH